VRQTSGQRLGFGQKERLRVGRTRVQGRQAGSVQASAGKGACESAEHVLLCFICIS
jgi:hypothetical protein